MRKQLKPPTAPEQPYVAKLAAVVEGLTHQVRQLALILDEVREDLVWAVRNDKFHAAGHSQHFVDDYLSEPDGTEDDAVETVDPPPVLPTSPVRPERTLFE